MCVDVREGMGFPTRLPMLTFEKWCFLLCMWHAGGCTVDDCSLHSMGGNTIDVFSLNGQVLERLCSDAYFLSNLKAAKALCA